MHGQKEALCVRITRRCVSNGLHHNPSMHYETQLPFNLQGTTPCCFALPKYMCIRAFFWKGCEIERQTISDLKSTKIIAKISVRAQQICKGKVFRSRIIMHLQSPCPVLNGGFLISTYLYIKKTKLK